MNNIQKLMQTSAKLYQHLSKFPIEDERENYIDEVHKLLDEREVIIASLTMEAFQFNAADKNHVLLSELDKGINERLRSFFSIIKKDLKDLQNAKKNEQQYINPYSNIQVMDGRYYDKKK